MNNNKNKKKKTTCPYPYGTGIPLESSVAMRLAYQMSGLRGKKLIKMFPRYCKATIYNHAKKPICSGEIKHDRRQHNKGRPPKLTKRDGRMIISKIKKLRRTRGSFTSKRVQLEAGMTHVSNRTVRRLMNAHNYRYLRSRKKGLLLPKDLPARLRFCNEIRSQGLTINFWRNQISFYFDGTGFVYKENPMDEAFAPKAREWRQPNEGLAFGCTAKGKKEGTTQAKFMVAISYTRGVVLCEQYFGRINGEKFCRLVDRCFPQAFHLSINPYDKLFLQDGDPSQNSALAMETFEDLGANVFSIPARSPDLNPIENFFHMVGEAIHEDTIVKEIRYETFEDFSARVHEIIINFPNTEIDKIINSMDRRIGQIIKAKGNRIKY